MLRWLSPRNGGAGNGNQVLRGSTFRRGPRAPGNRSPHFPLSRRGTAIPGSPAALNRQATRFLLRVSLAWAASAADRATGSSGSGRVSAESGPYRNFSCGRRICGRRDRRRYGRRPHPRRPHSLRRARPGGAARGVVKKVLVEASHAGLPGEHHFFIAFNTTAPGVRILHPSPQNIRGDDDRAAASVLGT